MSNIPPGSAIGVDLGGTKIHAAVVGPDGTVIAEHRLPTDVGGGPTKIVEDIVRACLLYTSDAADDFAVV